MRDTPRAAVLRRHGSSWREVAELCDFPSANAARKATKRYLRRQKSFENPVSPGSEFLDQETGVIPETGRVVQKWVKLEDGSTVHVKMPDLVVDESEARAALEEYKADVLAHSPVYDAVERMPNGLNLLGGDDEACSFELAIHDRQ